MFRHGDVQLVRIKEIPETAQKIANRKELAYGEVTGHAHRVDCGDILQTENGDLYFSTRRPANVSHEEHKTSVVPAGNYRVYVKRQANEEGWEPVQD